LDRLKHEINRLEGKNDELRMSSEMSTEIDSNRSQDDDGDYDLEDGEDKEFVIGEINKFGHRK